MTQHPGGRVPKQSLVQYREAAVGTRQGVPQEEPGTDERSPPMTSEGAPVGGVP